MTQVRVESSQEGTILPIVARAGARRSALSVHAEGLLRVHVTQVAEKGKANQAILELLAKRLGLRRSQMRLIAGSTSSRKRILIVGVTVPELRQAIDRALAPRSD